MPHSNIAGRTRGRARHLRREPTIAERRLWPLLRAMRAEGWHWRRQAPIGPFIVDFACLSARLVVELDGSQHADSRHDAARDTWLGAEGYRVMRFWNSDFLRNPEGCCELILAALAESAGGPAPPP